MGPCLIMQNHNSILKFFSSSDPDWKSPKKWPILANVAHTVSLQIPTLAMVRFAWFQPRQIWGILTFSFLQWRIPPGLWLFCHIKLNRDLLRTQLTNSLFLKTENQQDRFQAQFLWNWPSFRDIITPRRCFGYRACVVWYGPWILSLKISISRRRWKNMKINKQNKTVGVSAVPFLRLTVLYHSVLYPCYIEECDWLSERNLKLGYITRQPSPTILIERESTWNSRYCRQSIHGVAAPVRDNTVWYASCVRDWVWSVEWCNRAYIWAHMFGHTVMSRTGAA